MNLIFSIFINLFFIFFLTNSSEKKDNIEINATIFVSKILSGEKTLEENFNIIFNEKKSNFKKCTQERINFLKSKMLKEYLLNYEENYIDFHKDYIENNIINNKKKINEDGKKIGLEIIEKLFNLDNKIIKSFNEASDYINKFISIIENKNLKNENTNKFFSEFYEWEKYNKDYLKNFPIFRKDFFKIIGKIQVVNENEKIIFNDDAINKNYYLIKVFLENLNNLLNNEINEEKNSEKIYNLIKLKKQFSNKK